MNRRTIILSAILALGSVFVLNAQSVIVGSGGILAQEESGSIGNFGLNDEWGAFGKAPFPAPVTGDFPYGQRVQREKTFSLFQLSDRISNSLNSKVDANIFWGDNTTASAKFVPSRLDFRYLTQTTGSQTFPPTVIVNQSAPITMIGADRKFINATDAFFCFSQVGVPNLCHIRMGIERDNPTYSLDVNGVTRTNFLIVGSDARFKQNIATIENGMSILNNLRGTTYEMRADTDFEEGQFTFGEGQESGFIAQEIEKILPHLVYTDEQGFKAVNYIGVIPYLVEGVKHVNDAMEVEVATLKESNADLRAENAEVNRLNEEQESRINDLESRLAEIEGQIALSSDKSAASAMDMEGVASVLFQNTPNPFDAETKIRIQIAEGSQSAQVLIFDMNGRQIRTFSDLQNGENALTIQGSELEAGMYFYSLVVDGEEIDTKRMILTK